LRTVDDRAGGAMVIGIGTDLTEIGRVERSIERYGERFLERVFTAEERAYCLRKKSSAESFAARFAAKEAAAKALGTGISRGVSWQEFEVRREPRERPTLHLAGRAAELARELGVERISLSLTHSRELAMAVVVMEGTDRPVTGRDGQDERE
jgi:holo-[acyl-carrier protein] synthase